MIEKFLGFSGKKNEEVNFNDPFQYDQHTFQSKMESGQLFENDNQK